MASDNVSGTINGGECFGRAVSGEGRPGGECAGAANECVILFYDPASIKCHFYVGLLYLVFT